VSLLDRVINTVLALLCIVLATVLIAIASGWEATSSLGVVIERMRAVPWETAIIVIAVLAAGLRLLAGVSPERPEGAVVHETEFGQVRVSLQAIEHAVRRSVQQLLGVRSLDVNVVLGSEGVDVHLVLVATGDVTIPDLSTQVQQTVERYVRETIGVAVGSVAVEISAVTGDVRRVE
jgi:uncharacterized alkaline shock family protein YloU